MQILVWRQVASIRDEYVLKLKEHKRCNKTSSLLGSAIKMSEGQPDSYKMVLLGASVDEVDVSDAVDL